MNVPLISIVVPTFNSERNLHACLGSIAEQTYGNAEIVVVDGLSSDATIEIIREFESRYPDLHWTSEQDAGIYDAINKGVCRAKGEWVHVLGSDDRLFVPTTLASMAPCLGACSEDVVYGNVLVKGNAGWAEDGQIYDGEFDLRKLLQRNVCQQAVFYRRSLFARIGCFNIDYPVCADWDLMLRCAGNSSMKYVDVIVAVFSGGGASKVVREDRFFDDFARNMFAYFGSRIFGKEFQSVAWRFRQLAEAEAARGNSGAELFCRQVPNKLPP